MPPDKFEARSWVEQPGVAKLNKKELEWVQLRQSLGLSHAHIQMARELEILPRALAKVTDPPVPTYLQQLYQERFGRSQPQQVLSVEQRAKQEQRENAMEKLARKNSR